MKWNIVYLLVGVSCGIDAFSVSDIISNYAKVVSNTINPGGNTSSTEATTVKFSTAQNESDDIDDDEPSEYDDFDDTTTERSRGTSSDPQTMLKFVNGFVNLMALMYKFSGNAKYPPRQSPPMDKSRSVPHPKSKPQPRNTEGDLIPYNVNALAEGRFNPTTATKKFKLRQGAYSSGDSYKGYAGSGAETYSSNGGKTSYDSDSSQYMIRNPNSSDMGSTNDQPKDAGDSYKAKPPMKDYMNQNDVEVQQSYSYEIPQAPNKPISMAWSQQPQMTEPHSGPNPDHYQPWHSIDPMKQPEEESDKPSPVYYPWMSSPSKDVKPKPLPIEEGESPEEEDSHPPQLWDANPKKLKSSPHDDEPHFYYSRPPSNKKPVAPPPEEDDAPSHPWDTMPEKPKTSPPDDDDHFYISRPSKKQKPSMPPADEEDDDDDASSWGVKPPAKSKPPPAPPLDDHAYPYYGHDHGVIFHGDHHDHFENDHDHDHHDEEEDHHMKDEDRENKRPYTYYHLGRKLWYVPLLFSLYFIVYIASLILKSIARHKVQFPEKLWELNDHHHHHHHDEHSRRGRKIDEVTERVYDHLDQAQNKFM